MPPYQKRVAFLTQSQYAMCAWRGKARPGESGEVAIRMLLEVGLKLLAPIAVLHGVPESEIESFRGGFLRCRCRGTWRAERRCIEPCSGERGKGTFRILLEVGFHLGRAAVLDVVPKRELEGDLVVGGQFGDLRRSGRQFGYLSCLGSHSLLEGDGFEPSVPGDKPRVPSWK